MVNRNCKTKPLRFTVRGFCIDDTDELPRFIEQPAAGVSGADCRIGLQKRHTDSVDINLPFGGADDSVGHGAAQRTERVADGNDILSHHKIRTAPQLRAGQIFVAGINVEHRQIGHRVIAAHRCDIGRTVGQLDRDGIGAGNNVVVGDDHTSVIGRNNHAAPRSAQDILTVPGAVYNLLRADFHHRVFHHGNHLRQ